MEILSATTKVSADVTRVTTATCTTIRMRIACLFDGARVALFGRDVANGVPYLTEDTSP